MLLEHEMLGIALIVFVASVFVPFAKLTALAWLCFVRTRRPYSRPSEHRILLIIEAVGRWSMLDVFLVGFLTGLIQFGGFASVKPGPAIIPFAIAVILTIFAVKQFDLSATEPSKN